MESLDILITRILLICVAIALLFGISYLVATEFYALAVTKGYTDRKYFWICFWLGLPGWLLIMALPHRENSAPAISDELPDL